MARRIRSASLETRTDRLKLPVRRKPYFAHCCTRRSRSATAAIEGRGTWSVRVG